MHKIQEKEFTLEDFSTDKIIDTGEPGYENMYNGLALTLHYDSEKQYYDPHDIFSEILIPALNLYRKRYLACEEALRSNAIYGINSEEQRKKIKEKQKQYWWQMIQLLPSSYNQTRNVMMNYEVLANIYKSRKNHKLDEWREFCKWIETLPYSELITGSESLKNNIEKALGNGVTPNVDIDDIKALTFVPNVAREAVGLKPVIVSKED